MQKNNNNFSNSIIFLCSANSSERCAFEDDAFRDDKWGKRLDASSGLIEPIDGFSNS